MQNLKILDLNIFNQMSAVSMNLKNFRGHHENFLVCVKNLTEEFLQISIRYSC